MKQTGLNSILIDEINAIAKKHNINKVILFGSRARGDYHRASDIDLAVSGGNITRFTLDIEEETSTPLKYDVVNLNENISKQLLKFIESEGIILYEKI
ncbi:MAG: nucleotidyltransferase domain-containing protein [Hespellia sp.]|nr:nucleotidyltransferase domain-containing protein [Hespellia sp.]